MLTVPLYIILIKVEVVRCSAITMVSSRREPAIFPVDHRPGTGWTLACRDGRSEVGTGVGQSEHGLEVEKQGAGPVDLWTFGTRYQGDT